MLNIFVYTLLIFNTFQKSDVYFTKEISSKNIVNMFKKLDYKLEGKVGLKVHTGERGGKYFLRPSFLQEIYTIIQKLLLSNVILLIQVMRDIPLKVIWEF